MAERAGDAVLHRLLAVLAAVAVIWLLRSADAVFLPLAFAVFLIGIFWPLQRRLQERMPRVAAMLVTLAVFLVAVGLFGWALAESLDAVAERAPRYRDQLQGAMRSLRDRLGLPPLEGGGIERRIQDWAVSRSRGVVSLVGGVVLVVAYFVLGLLEVFDFRAKMDRVTSERRHREWREPVHRISRDFQGYMVVRTVIGLITGVGVGLATWLIGLDFALLWGVLNFLLNYIPTIGSILAVAPVVLFASIQGGWSLALLALVVVGGFQVAMGVFIDPKMQGRYLRLSPLVVLVSIAFWEWVWGIPGAFLGVPLTVGLVITCARFDSTRWIAVLLSNVDDGGQPQVASGPDAA